MEEKAANMVAELGHCVVPRVEAAANWSTCSFCLWKLPGRKDLVTLFQTVNPKLRGVSG